jgi:hypothetical protein
VVQKTVSAIFVWLAFACTGSANDVLYATDGKQLFTVALQTGALTFQSDGPLQWIASPAFDEPHYTRFWATVGSYTWGNPFTGEQGTATTRWFQLRSNVETPLVGGFQVCLKCGLVWSHVSPEKLRAIIENQGTDEAKSHLPQ